MLLRGALAEAVYGRVERGGPALPPHQRILQDQAEYGPVGVVTHEDEEESSRASQSASLA